MRFEDWEPLYLDILRDMGYDRAGDETSAGILSDILSHMDPKRFASLQELRDSIAGKDVLICGNAPGLKEELDLSGPTHDIVIAADGAAAVLLRSGIIPVIIVTDLDGDIEAEVQASEKGSIMLVHAHGDNIKAIMSIVPRLYHVIGTTQAAPLKNVYNFGGFTDGDRCVFVAAEFNAASISLMGFDFEDPGVTSIKRKKLKWARKLIDIALETKI